MGSQTYEGHYQYRDASSSASLGNPAGDRPCGTDLLKDGDGNFESGDDDDDDDRSDGGKPSPVVVVTAAGTKKKMKKRKKKKGTKNKPGFQKQQSSPPRVPLSELFPNGNYPAGQIIVPEDENLARTTGEELRYLSRDHIFDDSVLSDYRLAAEVHRQVRGWVHEVTKPGMPLTELAVGIEDGVRALTGHQGLEPGDSLKAGMGFPTGLSLNHCAAHFTPNPGQKDILLKHQDVLKVDFGVHVNGWIVDSAFTLAFDPIYDNLLCAVKDATNTGLKCSGIDARMSEIGSSIQETMEAYEVEIGGKTYPVKAIRNITGHDILRYTIHGGKHVPFVKNNDQTKMEEGEVFAIETFGSTGRGRVRDGIGVYGYGKEANPPVSSLYLSSARSLLNTINENFGTIVFCRRYLDRLGLDRYLLGMNSLVKNGIVNMYPPLDDIAGCYVSQFEHTILLKSSGNEIISRGDDY